MKNKYLYRAHISETKFREILRYFCADQPASKTAQMSGVSRNSINALYYKLRLRMVQLSVLNTPELGELEVDESYFGAKRVRGKRGRGAAGKTPVFGILKREGKVYVNIVKNCTKAQLLPIIQGKVLEGSTIYSDGWKAYDGLILNGYDHYRVYHSHDEFVRGKAHVNGIESFWSFTKRRLAKFNGLTDTMFHLHLKEGEFRWNYRTSMYQILLKECRENPL
ncbi:MAG: IS1595 family transposase [Pseudomonadales bacterium]|nr:IS1595 family transposase [Candidatus Woesebacteria bacterium]MCB9801573.1 IS1595 family transposase [Pseudomonadales bacterium]